MTSTAPSRPQRLRWQAVWQLHSPVVLVVRATPAECLQTLMRAAKPSTDRLHLRNLFAEGRRYYLEPQPNGFKLRSDNRLLWGGRRRTRVAATVFGGFSTPQDEITFIRLHSRMNVLYLLSGLVIPLFFSSIVIYMPWSPVVIGMVVTLLFVLSLLGHRFNAALQVNEMIYYVQKVIEDLPPVEVAELPASGPDVVLTNSDFREQWRKFYREQTQKDQEG